MRTIEILCPEPSLFAWSRTARPVRFGGSARSRPAASAPTPRPRAGGVDDALFASASIGLVATLLVVIVAG